jgi:hypothetical protein
MGKFTRKRYTAEFKAKAALEVIRVASQFEI